MLVVAASAAGSSGRDSRPSSATWSPPRSSPPCATPPRPAKPSAAARTQALDDFSTVAATGPEGYRTLARLRAAALKAAAGDLPAALALWDQVSADTAADPLLRDFANLLWVQHQVDAGDPAAVQGRLAPLIAPGNPWRPLALESQAWLLLRTGETDKAHGDPAPARRRPDRAPTACAAAPAAC